MDFDTEMAWAAALRGRRRRQSEGASRCVCKKPCPSRSRSREQSARFLHRDERITGVTVDLGESAYTLKLEDGRLEASVALVVRGIAISTKPIPPEDWFRRLGEETRKSSEQAKSLSQLPRRFHVELTVGLFDWLSGLTMMPRRAGRPPRRADNRISCRRCTTAEPPSDVATRLRGAGSGTQPWIATLTPAELLALRSHGTNADRSGFRDLLAALRLVLDRGHARAGTRRCSGCRPKPPLAAPTPCSTSRCARSRLPIDNSMDFTLIGTAVKVEGLAPQSETDHCNSARAGIRQAAGERHRPHRHRHRRRLRWITDWQGRSAYLVGNGEYAALSRLMEQGPRTRVRAAARPQPNRATASWPTSISARCSREEAAAEAISWRGTSSSRHDRLQARDRRSRTILKWSWTCTRASAPLESAPPHHHDPTRRTTKKEPSDP